MQGEGRSGQGGGPSLKANARMYSLSPGVARLWSELVAHVARLSGVALEMIDHPPPRPIEAMWARDDLGLVLMCGWPYWRASPRPEAIAAPLLDAAGVGDRPVYWTDMIVRAESGARTLEDTFGGTLAWTVRGSHSGFNAPRYLLLEHFRRRGAPLFAGIVPDVITPRGAIEAVLSGRADVAPLDGYFHLLLRRHETDLAAGLRVVARTPDAPMPLFTASAGTAPATVARLRTALEALHRDAEAAETLRALAIRRFAPVDAQDYALGDRWEAEALAAGYDAPG